MDIFNRKKIRELEAKLFDADMERNKFGKVYHYTDHYDFSTNTRICNKIYVCGKGESCQHFIQKEIKE